jgi:hypothetical protein
MCLRNLAAAIRIRYRRRHAQPWFSVFCACVLPFGLAAQNIADKAEGATALSLVRQAMGGARWDDIRTLHAQGKVQLGELQGDYEGWLDVRHLYSYMELRFSHPALGDLRFVTGWNGSLAWSADQTGDVCVSSSESAKHDAAGDAYLEAFGYLLESTSPVSLSVKKDVTLRPQRFHVLLVAPPVGSPFELWTDSFSSRIARIVPLKGVDRDVIVYGDFRPSGGLILPFRLEEHDANSGKLSDVRVINSIEVDHDPPQRRFDPPAAVLSGLQFPPGSDFVSLQFRYDNGHIYLPVSIDGRRLENFIFDTGGENTIDVALARSMGLKVVKVAAAYGGGAKGVESGISKVERLEIGGLQMENQIINVIPLGGAGLANGGVVGYELAKRSVVTIDYGLHRITFTKPESFRPPAGATRLPLRFAAKTSILVDASVDGSAGEFDLDTGSSGSLFLHRPFAEQSGLLQKYGSGTKESVSGVGGEAGAVFFVPSQFAIGSLTPSNTVAGIMLSKTGGGAQEYVAGNIGNAILRQYKVTLDYGNGAVYLESDPSYRGDRDWTFTPGRKDSQKRGNSGDLGLSGLRRRFGGPVEILGIAAGGPASRAGVKRGDWILAVDGAPVGDLTLERLFDQLFARPGTVVRLTIRHGDVTRDIKLTTQ